MLSHLSSRASFYRNSLLSWLLLFIAITANETRIQGAESFIKFGLIQSLVGIWWGSGFLRVGFLLIVILLFYIVRRHWIKIILAALVSVISTFALISLIPGSAGLGAFNFIAIWAMQGVLTWSVFLMLIVFENSADADKALKRINLFNILLSIIIIGLIIANAYGIFKYHKEQSLFTEVSQTNFDTKEDALSACNKIELTGPPIDLRHNCIKEVAVQFKDMTLCPHAEFVNDSNCWSAVAAAASDIRICEQIPKPATNDVQSEAVYSNRQRDCAQASVYLGAKEDYCDRVSDNNLMGNCLFVVAKQTLSIATCSKIPPVTWMGALSYKTHDECLAYVVPKAGTREDCNLMSSSVYPLTKTWCLESFDN